MCKAGPVISEPHDRIPETDQRPQIVHIVGARPNFVKAAPVVRGLAELGVRQVLVHTGQHYDPALSEVFFTDLGLPQPTLFLGVGSGAHAQQTAALMLGIDQAVTALKPELLVLYGDINSTLAAALVAAKRGLPIAHVEAGLRSFDRSMPEEINRKVVDALADIALVTSPEGIAHLGAEGVAAHKIHFVGNPMIDSLLTVRELGDLPALQARLSLPDRYAVATLHRPSNVDSPEAARSAVAALAGVSAEIPVVLPLHPRGRASLNAAGLADLGDVRVVEPLGYVEFAALLDGAALVVTDSGGIQEETTILGVPCLTLRPNTERPITITEGTNRLVTPETLGDAVRTALAADRYTGEGPPLWDGRAGQRIAKVLHRWLEEKAPT